MGKEYVVADDLTSVWLNCQGKWLWVKDEDGDALNPSYNTQSLPVPDLTADTEYDQSNWAQLILNTPAANAQDIQGHMLLAQTVIGRLTDAANPTFELLANPIPAASAPYTPNTFFPANFVEQETYFMVEPKPQEYVNVEWAICREKLNDTTYVMAIPKSDGDVNGENLSGAFMAVVKQGYWEDMASFDPASSIRVNYGYGLTGIVRAIDSNLLNGIAPDDAGHSPVSNKWELYLVSATQTQVPVKLGDVNDDGFVTIKDVTILIDFLLGSNPQPFNETNADVNVNGSVTIADVTTLIDMLLLN